MTLRNFLLAWHIATRQNPRMAVALEQAIRGKDVLAPFLE
ncbi:DNA-protecting protein DprA, partial [Lacticaseibacillus paracasei]